MSARLLLYIIWFFVISACKGPQVVSFVNPKIDFANFKTYRILASSDEGELDTTAVNEEIESLITKQMEGRGYQLNKPADLRVQYHFISNNRTDINVSPNYWDRPNYYDPFGLPYRSYNVRQRNFYEAILLIEMKNKAAKVVWQGSLDLKYTKKTKNKKDILPNAVLQIFSNYPYEAGNNKPVNTN